MATYAIGDIQGCFEPLQRLLDEVGFDARGDRLWLVGDLVNRGPDSLATLRFVQSLGEASLVVLGNHDLHLLAVAEGYEKLKREDTLQQVLDAPDRDALLDWLRQCPLMHFEDGWAMVHAGLLPAWSVSRALELAAEVEAALRAPTYRSFLARMYGNHPERWSDALAGHDRLRVIVNAMTRMRLCTVEGEMEFAHKGRPKQLPAGYLPWFDVPERRSRDTPLIFGHWSALGLIKRPDLFGLDTGCLWGRRLTALRLEDRRLFQVRCRDAKAPGRAR
ncbi:MAG TPA: symmetrical bis(5'-nucleosyl)-tetraphosphatase [Burkholderiales bacterium]|jgi:bis(5'-nucleosyl)-tetraphosphatase (symmetrical)